MGLSKKGIIIDATAFHTFVDKSHKDAEPIHDCITKQKLQLVCGNDNQSVKEIGNSKRMKKMVATLDRRGAVYYADSKKEKEKIDSNDKFINGIKLKSNDTHIIAVALIEKKARILFSDKENGDKKLVKDFTNTRIIKPKGSVYQTEKHKHLLYK